MGRIYCRFRRSINLRNTFHRLIFSYIAIISIILLISAVILYNGYKNQIVEQSSNISEKLLNQADYYSQYTLHWASSYIYQLYLDKDINDIVFSNSTGSNDISNGISKIKQSVVLQQTIQTIYLYNSKNNTIYPSDGDPSDFSSFYDKDLEKILKENEDTMSTKFIPRKVNMNVGGRTYVKNVLTLLLTNVKSSETNLPYGAIVLNLNANDIQNYYKNITDNEYEILAIDSKGRVVLNSDPKLFLEDISDRDYIKKILTSANSSGRFFSTINGIPSIIIYKTSDRLGLKFINIIPYETFTGSINKMLKLLISSSLILFLLGIIIAFFSFKRIYSPIDKTIKTVREYIRSSGNTETGVNVNEINEKYISDMDYLAKEINLIISRPIQLQKLQSSDLYFIKKQLFIGLLFNTSFEIYSFKNKLRELEAKIDFENIVVLVFKIDSYQTFEIEHSKDEFEKIKSSINGEAIKIISEYYKNEIVVTDEDEFCIIISIEKEIDEDAENNLTKAVDSIQEYSYNNYLIPISAAIGDYVYNIEDTSKSYKSAREYIKYRFKYGQRSILSKSRVDSDILGDKNCYEDIENAIFRELKAGNIDRVEKELDKMFNVILKLNYNDIISAISRLFASSAKVINSIQKMSRNDVDLNIGNSLNDTNKFQTAEETKVHLLRIYINTINQLKEQKKNRKNDIIDNVLNYIYDNYSCATLSTETIASNMNLSPNYLRILFKDVEAKSLSSYINEVRFKNAKLLLESTELTVAEISVKVGFTNDNYFYTAFKKFYGVSPNNYRNNVKAEILNI